MIYMKDILSPKGFPFSLVECGVYLHSFLIGATLSSSECLASPARMIARCDANCLRAPRAMSRDPPNHFLRLWIWPSSLEKKRQQQIPAIGSGREHAGTLPL